MDTRVRISPQRQIAKLTKIGIALSSELNLEKLLHMIVSEARHLLNCDGASLYTVEGEYLRFRVVQCGSLGVKKSAKALGPMLFKIDKTRIATYVALTGKPLNIPDVYEIPPTAEYGFKQDVDLLMQYRTRSMLALPIRPREGAVIGVLQLINAFDGKGRRVPQNVVPFTEQDEALATSLASMAGVAMRNAQLLEDLRALLHGVVRFSSAAIDARDPASAGHSRRVRELVMRMARAINRCRRPPFADITFSPQQMEALRYAAWLHDVGKIAISEELLKKGQRLPPCQLEVIKVRFQLIRQTLLANGLLEKIKALRESKDPESEVAQIEARLQSQLERVNDDLAFIIECAGTRPLTQAARERLLAIADKRCVTCDGLTIEYLRDDELEHLCIPRGTLTPQELSEVRRHVRETEHFLSEIPFRGGLKDTPRIASLHHEMLDGTGYPYGLKGDQIPLEARMLVIADVFDAMTAADRPYRKALPLRRALKILREEARKNRFDPQLVELFCKKRLYRPFPVPEEEEQHESPLPTQ